MEGAVHVLSRSTSKWGAACRLGTVTAVTGDMLASGSEALRQHIMESKKSIKCAKKKVLLHLQFLPKPTRGEYLISLLCTHYFVEVVSAPRALFPFPAANAKAPTSSFSAPKAVPFKGLHVARSVPPLFAHYVVIYHPLPSDRISCVCTTASRHRPIVLRDA